MAFAAKYKGECADCLLKVRVGDLVRYTEDDRLVHDDCDDIPPSDEIDDEPARAFRPLQPNETVCTSCFIVKPCRCDDDQ